MDDKIKRRPNEISTSRVKTIMKSSPDVENVSQESVYLVTKATEMFIKLMVEEAYNASGNAGTLDYKHVSQLVQTSEELAFLREIVPRKCTLQEIEEYQRQKGLKIRRPGSPSSSDVSFSSDDEINFPSANETSHSSPHSSSSFAHEAGNRSGAPASAKGRTSSNNYMLPPREGDKQMKGKKANTMKHHDAEEAEFHSVTLSREYVPQSPMSVVSISSGSRTPSPSPSYSSLSPDANSVVHVDAGSSHSSDCEIIE